MTFCPPWHIGSALYLFISPSFSYSFTLLFPFFLHLCKWLFSFLVCNSWIFFLSTSSWVTLLLFFLSLCSFNPTFQSIPHNSHPQLMALPWVKVHNTQSWVRAIKRLFTALSTLNLCFWHKLRCTCPRRDQGQHIVPRKDQMGWRRKIYFKLKLFVSIRDYFIWFFSYYRLKIDYFEQGPMLIS